MSLLSNKKNSGDGVEGTAVELKKLDGRTDRFFSENIVLDMIRNPGFKNSPS